MDEPDEVETRKARRLTAVLLLIPIVLWAAYDVAIYAVRGGQATISVVVGGWLAFSLWIVAAFGLLSGHFFGSTPSKDGDPLRLLVFLGAFVSGFALTRIKY